MGSMTSPRGRLPKRVYWVRRALVVAVALLLVFGIGKLVGAGGSDAPSGDTAANSAANSAPTKPPAASRSAAVLPVGPTAVASTPGAAKASGSAVPLVAPSGPCADDEVSVTPSIAQAWAGGRVTIALQLQGTQPACTFSVSSSSVVVKVTSGSDRIWSTQDCPKAVPSREVVVRSGVTTTVPVTWSGRRSDAECSSSPSWALPGFYHVLAAAYGSTPSDQQFEITRAPTRRVTQTPTPTPSAKPSAKARPGAAGKQASPAPTPSATPSRRG